MNLHNYRKIVGSEVVDNIYERASKLSGKRIVTVSSTYQGGGVAEMLNRLMPLYNEVGIKAGWRILHGSPDYFTVTKKFHNALQGERINLSERKKEMHYETNRRFSVITHIEDHDLVIVHDPQPLPLIDFYEKKQPWIWRCHVDLSRPNRDMWNYLKTYIEKYDRFVVSREEYKKDLKIPQSIIYPAIDPLSNKNRELPEREVRKYLSKYGIDQNKPIISQISRFDKWKDPLGVVQVFEKVREKKDCTLVLLGSLASDDPEGSGIHAKVMERVAKSKYKSDVKIVLVENDTLANCLQRASSVVIQKSLKEGFGLTVSEALYKGTPVVASKIGGIPLQVINGKNGFLNHPLDTIGFSKNVIRIMEDDLLRKEMGANGKEHITNNFLITRLMLDWFDIFERHLC